MSAALAQEPLTRSVEDYLKVIYRLTQRGQPASTRDIAGWLQLSAPSVSGMLRRLAEQGLVEHSPYRGVQLTDDGRRVALRMVRRHRIIESYLVAFLGYTWDDVHEEAERLEHAVSDRLIERMAAALGHPRFDPHGDPIPDEDLSVDELSYVPLTDIPVGGTAEVRQVGTDQPERLRYLAAVGLTPGTTVTILDRQPFQGPITVRGGAGEQVIGHELGGMVLCAPAERQEEGRNDDAV
ncbi:MAG TPA: metal-dependent transcriptional regulator [Gemmatimonadales bacterium]|nr:metal-dependent transcriptional regulator [Gemmatimonadales bacterium]